MNLVQLTTKSDVLGTITSTLCLLHCIATPLLFVGQAELAGHGDSHPVWWGFLDILFLAFSYFAVWWSSKNTTKKWIGYSLWISWGVLTLIVLNEKFELLPIPEVAIYAPTISLIALHLYNKRYCQCGDESCCIEKA